MRGKIWQNKNSMIGFLNDCLLVTESLNLKNLKKECKVTFDVR